MKEIINRIYVIPILSILNSLYLSFVYLEAFMLNKFNKELISNFTLILISTLLIINGVIIILNLISKEGKKKNVRDYFIEKILPLIFCFFFMLFVYDSLKSDYNGLLEYSVAIFIETLSIAFAIGKKRESALIKLLGIVFVWVCVGTICFSITGIFEHYLGYNELQDSNTRLIFTAIFYHLFNACFLLYYNLPEYMTQGVF